MNVLELARPDLINRLGYFAGKPDVRDPLRLNANENPWPPVNATIPFLNHYPDQQPAELINRLSQIYGVAADCLLVARGADDGIDCLIRGFCQPGADAIVHCPPTFVMYDFFAKLHGTAVIDAPLNQQDGFAIDQRAIRQAVGEGAKMVFLCIPNNPTGTAPSRSQVLELASELRDHALVVADEAYIEFADQPSLCGVVTEYPNLVVLRTLSKAFSLAGLRMGTVIACPQVIDYLLRIMVPYPLSRSSVDHALSCLADDCLVIAQRRIDQIIEQRRQLALALAEFDWIEKVFPSQANFLLVKVADAANLLQYAADRGILLRNQSSQAGLENCLRITVGRSEDMHRLLTVFRQWKEC